MATIYLVCALVIAAVGVIFALQNATTVTISFLAWKVTGSLSLVLLATLIIGTVSGLLALAPSAITKSMAVASHRKRIAALEKQLDEHRQTMAELQAPKPENLQASSVPTPPAESTEPKQ